MKRNYIKISPNYEASYLMGDLDSDELIDREINIFEDRINGWLLDFAELVNKKEHGAFALLNLTMAYFEMMYQYKSGERSDGKSEQAFWLGIIDVFPELSTIPVDIQKSLYKNARCGLYHKGMTRKGIFINDAVSLPVQFDGTSIHFQRNKYLKSIRSHFAIYVSSLKKKENTGLRENFHKIFDDN